MAEQTLEQLAKDINGKGNIVKIWVAGFAPMERRQVAYQAFQAKYPDIKEVAAFGAATQNTALDTQAQMEAILRKYPNKGDIAAVWASWDEFAKGAARAIQQAGRTEIKVYGIDMSDEDLQMIQDRKILGSPPPPSIRKISAASRFVICTRSCTATKRRRKSCWSRYSCPAISFRKSKSPQPSSASTSKAGAAASKATPIG